MKKFLTVVATFTVGWLAGMASIVWMSEQVSEHPEWGKGEIYNDDNITVTALTDSNVGYDLAAVKFKK
jgi:hypothetical protein